MVERKYKIRKKTIRKYEKKRGKGFGDGFKFLYSLGKQWCKSMQWDEKKIMQWWNLMFPRE